MRNFYSKINIPMINTGGWYDIFLQGTVDNFVGLQTRGGDKARGNQKLLMDCFGHGPELQSELQLPKEARSQRNADLLRWFDYWMKGIDNGIMKEPAVRYWVLGDALDKSAPGNVWRTGDTWPPKSTATSYYLQANAKLSRELPGAEGQESYRYDPRDPAPTAGGNNLNLPKGPFDQRKVSSR